jgi:hypothetical protein
VALRREAAVVENRREPEPTPHSALTHRAGLQSPERASVARCVPGLPRIRARSCASATPRPPADHFTRRCAPALPAREHLPARNVRRPREKHESTRFHPAVSRAWPAMRDRESRGVVVAGTIGVACVACRRFSRSACDAVTARRGFRRRCIFRKARRSIPALSSGTSCNAGRAES